MEHLLVMAIVAVLAAAPHWPLVAFVVASFMALIDLACAGWVAVYVAVRALEAWLPIKNRASVVESKP